MSSEELISYSFIVERAFSRGFPIASLGDRFSRIANPTRAGLSYRDIEKLPLIHGSPFIRGSSIVFFRLVLSVDIPAMARWPISVSGSIG